MIAVPIIEQAVKKELWSVFSTEAHKTSDLLRYINSSARAIAIEKNFAFNQYSTEITVVEWTTSYSIPYQIETFFIKKSDTTDMEFTDFVWYYGTSDKSSIIWIWDDTLICTIPWTYTIFYRGYPPTITSLSDTLVIPEHFFDLVVLKAIYFAYMDIRAYEKAGQKDNIFKGMIKSMATRSSNSRPLEHKRLNKSKSKVW